MFLNFIKQFFRIQKREKLYSFITVFGLSMGISVFLIVALFVKHEYSYDSHLKNADNIVMYLAKANIGTEPEYTFATGSAPMGPGITNEVEGISSFLRILEQNQEAVFAVEETSFLESRFAFADSTLFEYFDLELSYGDPKTALTQPNSVVLSEKTAQKYFGNKDPIGKTIILDGHTTYNVTGVYIPSKYPSTLEAFPLFNSMSTLRGIDDRQWIGEMNYKLLFMLDEGYDIASVSPGLEAVVYKYTGEFLKNLDGYLNVYFQNIRKIHLNPDAISYFFGQTNNSASFLNQFMVVGIFILVLSILNFVNLSTARGASRFKFVGIAKTLGASRNNLIRRFIVESVLITTISMIIALIFVEIILPYITLLLGKNLEYQFLEKSWHWLAIGLFTFIVGAISGYYPALILSKQKPVKILYGNNSTGNRKSKLRSFLVLAQFIIVIVLISGSLIIGRQMNYLFSKDLGYNTEQILSVRMGNWDQMLRSETLINEISKLAEIESVTYADNMLLENVNDDFFHIPGQPESEGFVFNYMPVDHNFMNTFEMELLAGRQFDPNLSTDSCSSVILNETAVRELGYEDPIGKTIEILENRNPVSFSRWEIIGIVKDYNFQSLHHKINPMVMKVMYGYPLYHFYKINSSDIPNTMKKIEAIWEDYAPGFPIKAAFMDDKYDRLYNAEKQMTTLFNYLTTISIFIACMGLFALITYSAQQRTKEIGIRKVLGASVTSLVYLLVKEFLLLVTIAFVLACPIAYWVMDKWIANFAFQIDINAIPFAYAGILAVGIALLVVVTRAISAANKNPITAIKWE
jgi:putative ABC transport system permease protein